ncbi:MAG: HAD-IIIA family hydrolase [Acutalibacteraceae bacterium]
MKAVILAGGYGSRMGKLCEHIPKPLIELAGKPILQRQIETLKDEGVTEFIIVTHFLHDKIENYFGNGEKLGVNIKYFVETEPLGTAGAIFKMNFQDDFLLCNGDLLFKFSLTRMLNFHKKNNSLITVLTHPNSHPYDSITLVTDKNCKIVGMLGKENKPEFYSNLCGSGVYIISPEIFKLLEIQNRADLDKDVILPLIKTGRVYSYRSSEFVFDIGTPERLKLGKSAVANDLLNKKYYSNRQKAIFLDRDGTVNIYRGYINKPEQLELINGVAQGINIFHDLGYLVIIVTNQPVIARGECTEGELDEIHNKMETLLSKSSAYVDAVYYCPHHPDGGFDGEIKELKIQCDCRKPKPGLIFKAQEDFNIDLSESFMLGDTKTDILTALNAGCRPVLIGSNIADNLSVEEYESVYQFAQALKSENFYQKRYGDTV